MFVHFGTESLRPISLSLPTVTMETTDWHCPVGLEWRGGCSIARHTICTMQDMLGSALQINANKKDPAYIHGCGKLQNTLLKVSDLGMQETQAYVILDVFHKCPFPGSEATPRGGKVKQPLR